MSPSNDDKPFGWRFTAPLILGSTLNPINSSLIATGLVGIGIDLHTGPGVTAILVSVLYLCSAVMQPTMGKLSTLYGPRRIFLLGIVILFIGGLVGATAQSFAPLVISRALIGIGTSAAYPTAMALVRKRADDAGIGVPSRVIGNLAIAGQVTIALGLPIGGLLVGVFGWRSLFLVNLPLAMIGFVLTLVGIAKDDPIPKLGARRILAAVDLPGILLFAATTTALLVFLSDLTAPAWWLLAATVVLGAALILWERRGRYPLIDVRALAQNGPLQRTYIRQVLVSLSLYTALFGYSQWMEQSAGLDPAAVGLILLPLSGLSIIIARIASVRGWVRWPLILTGASLIVTAVVLYLTHSDSSLLLLVLTSVLFGFANGFSGFANQAALYGQTSAAEIAVASGLLRTFGYVGAIFSSSLIGIAFGDLATDARLHTLAWVVGGIGIALLLLSALDRSIPRTTSP